ncbi:DUF5959 family protein [Streptomyces sp. NPDC085946]|uniref:DUF5959 family protein n=1 Tax=Streptomyces sp. NPDC085946 TaxID=3365744 RepID=UPI0037D53901
MDAPRDAVDLIRLTDRPGRGLTVRVRGRARPGVLPDHDVLDGEIAVESESGRAVFPVALLPEDLEDWEDALSALESGRCAEWLDSGRTPSVSVGPAGRGGLGVAVHDGPATGTRITVLLPSLPGDWAAEQRALLARVREVFPQEVVETSPGTYAWRPGRTRPHGARTPVTD